MQKTGMLRAGFKRGCVGDQPQHSMDARVCEPIRVLRLVSDTAANPTRGPPRFNQTLNPESNNA